MNIQEQIKDYIASQPEPKRADIEALHKRILQVLPNCKLWFLDGKDAGIRDKTYLAQTYGKKLGKASVTGYCIKFKALKDINIDILEAAIRDGVDQTT